MPYKYLLTGIFLNIFTVWNTLLFYIFMYIVKIV